MNIYQEVPSGLFPRGLITVVSHCWYVKQMPSIFMEMLVATPALEWGGHAASWCCMMAILKVLGGIEPPTVLPMLIYLPKGSPYVFYTYIIYISIM